MVQLKKIVKNENLKILSHLHVLKRVYFFSNKLAVLPWKILFRMAQKSLGYTNILLLVHKAPALCFVLHPEIQRIFGPMKWRHF